MILGSPCSCLLDQPGRVNLELSGYMGTHVRSFKGPLASWASGGGRQRTVTKLAKVRDGDGDITSRFRLLKQSMSYLDHSSHNRLFEQSLGPPQCPSEAGSFICLFQTVLHI